MNNIEQRQQIRKAIDQITTGGAQEYQLGSKRIRRPDLSSLLEESRRIDMENLEGGRSTVAVFDKR